MLLKNSIAAMLGLVGSIGALATPLLVDPVSDGYVAVCDTCGFSEDGYVTTGGWFQGILKFSSASMPAKPSKVQLSITPYGLPLWSSVVEVYGYGSAESSITKADGDMGEYLGQWLLPPDLNFGMNAYFDVTSFVLNASSPYVAFNLRSAEPNLFSSLEYNYGHASQLQFTVPEPSSVALLAAGALALCVRRREEER
jgi:hypothetical protein